MVAHAISRYKLRVQVRPIPVNPHLPGRGTASVRPAFLPNRMVCPSPYPVPRESLTKSFPTWCQALWYAVGDLHVVKGCLE